MISVLFVLGGCSHSAYNTYTAENTALDSTYNSVELDGIIAPYRNEVNAQMNAVIGQCDSTLMKYAPESPLGNFAADVVFEKGVKLSPPHFDDMGQHNTVALLNFGGLRSPINKGIITIGNVFELMPFDNTITIVKLNSDGFQDLMTYLLTMNGQPTSNAIFNLRPGKYDVQINQKTGSTPEEVYIITSNYLASGGDKMNFLRDAKEKWDSGILIRDVFIEYITVTGEIENKGIDGRMKISK